MVGWVIRGKNKMNDEKYTALKEMTVECLKRIQDIAKTLNIENTAAKITQDIQLLNDEKFSLVVIGEFSRGKSTFVNALLGARVLPSSKEPTTNVISKIVYGKEQEYVLHYRDGKIKAVNEEEFSKIKAQSEPDQNQREEMQEYVKKIEDFGKIEFVEVKRPLKFCENNVELVDTPGTNDLNVGRMEITYNYLNHADAAILILSATQAYSKSEDEFLRERVLGNQIKDIFIVVNYKDQLDRPGQEQEVKEYVIQQIADLEQKEKHDLSAVKKRVFMVSGRQALLYRRQEAGETLKGKALMDVPSSLASTGFVDFEDAIGKYLFEERGMTKIKKYHERCNFYLDELEKYVGREQKMLVASLDDLKKKQEAEQQSEALTKNKVNVVIDNLKRRLGTLDYELLNLSNNTANNILNAAMAAVDNYEDEITSQGIQDAVSRAITPIHKQFIDTVNALQKNRVATECNKANDELKKIWQDFESVSCDLTETSGQQVMTGNSLQIVDIDSGDDFGLLKMALGFGAGWFLGPIGGLAALVGSWLFGSNDIEKAKSKIKAQLYEQLQVEFNSLGDNVTKKYKSVVENICQDMTQNIEKRINDLHNQIVQAIQEKESQRENISEKENILNKQLEAITVIRKDLEGVDYV